MLDALREGTRGWIAWVIIALLSIPFALWGIGNYAGLFSSPSVVAEVNGVKVTQNELTQAYQSHLRQLRTSLGQDYVPEHPAVVKKTVLHSLVGNQVLKLHALDSGYRVGDQQLVAYIHAMPVFQIGDKFSVKAYQARLQSAGYSTQHFENSIRQDMVVKQLQIGLTGSTFATNREFRDYVALVRQQRNVSYITIPAADYVADYTGYAKLQEKEIKAWYNTHQKAFMTPDTVKIGYIEINAKAIANNIKVNDQDLQALYQEKKAGFINQEQRKAAHILIVPANDSKKAEQDAKEEAESVLAKIKSGENFAAAARKYSDDPGSASKGGQLGWSQRGDLVPNFDKALFNANKVGTIIGPIKTKYGYHIIKLEGIRKPTQKSFEQVRAQLATEYRNKKANDEFYKLQNKLSNLAFDHSDSLEPIQDALKLPIKYVSDVTRDSGSGIASNEKVREAAFSNAVYEKGKNHPVELGDTHVIAMRDVERHPAKVKPLATVKAEIIKTLKHRDAQHKAKSVAEKVVGRIENHQSLGKAARQFVVHRAGFVTRQSDDVPHAIRKAAFVASIDAGKTAHVGMVALENGDYAVFIVDGVKPGKVSSLSKQEDITLRKRLLAMHAKANVAAYVSDLKGRADITIDADNIQTY